MSGKFLFGDAIGGNNEQKRHDWVKEALLGLPEGASLLDAGAGECRYKPYCQHLKYIAQDFCQYSGQGNASGLQTGKWDTSQIDIVSEITDIPAAAASYDAILCTEVLEHVPDPVATLQELHRLLKPGGMLILTAPFNSLTHFAPYHYCTGFSRYFYEYHLHQKLCYDILELSPNGNYFEVMAQELHRLPHVINSYHSAKSPASLRLLRLICRTYIRLLMYYNHRSAGSEALQVYGYHVRARKGLN